MPGGSISSHSFVSVTLSSGVRTTIASHGVHDIDTKFFDHPSDVNAAIMDTVVIVSSSNKDPHHVLKSHTE
jgi:hypothetical protein